MVANGNVKWVQFITVVLTIISIGVTITIVVTTSLFAAIRSSEARVVIGYEKNEKRIVTNEKLFYSIDKRLARIEDKLDIR